MTPKMIEAKAVLQRGESIFQWLVLDCPLCGKPHYHGAGTLDKNPQDYLGHRSAHCIGVDNTNGYVLVDFDDDKGQGAGEIAS